MSNDLFPPSPDRFGLVSFSELLPPRDPIIGEDPGSFDGFHDGMMASLAPITPYEAVIAENLVAIEWELLQHRRMRDAGLRRSIHKAIVGAVVARERAKYEDALDVAWEKHEARGGGEHNWVDPFEFDEDAAEQIGDELAARATSTDPKKQAGAQAEIVDMGMSPIDLMSEAYTGFNRASEKHDDKVQELERRRRDVRRDYDALQRARPIEGEVIDG
jgi:hypothetical protein